MIPREIIRLLVCPISLKPLIYDTEKNELISRSAKLAFPIRNGVPVMIISEARILED